MKWKKARNNFDFKILKSGSAALTPEVSYFAWRMNLRVDTFFVLPNNFAVQVLALLITSPRGPGVYLTRILQIS